MASTKQLGGGSERNATSLFYPDVDSERADIGPAKVLKTGKSTLTLTEPLIQVGRSTDVHTSLDKVGTPTAPTQPSDSAPRVNSPRRTSKQDKREAMDNSTGQRAKRPSTEVVDFVRVSASDQTTPSTRVLSPSRPSTIAGATVKAKDQRDRNDHHAAQAEGISRQMRTWKRKFDNNQETFKSEFSKTRASDETTRSPSGVDVMYEASARKRFKINRTALEGRCLTAQPEEPKQSLKRVAGRVPTNPPDCLEPANKKRKSSTPFDADVSEGFERQGQERIERRKILGVIIGSSPQTIKQVQPVSLKEPEVEISEERGSSRIFVAEDRVPVAISSSNQQIQELVQITPAINETYHLALAISQPLPSKPTITKTSIGIEQESVNQVCESLKVAIPSLAQQPADPVELTRMVEVNTGPIAQSAFGRHCQAESDLRVLKAEHLQTIESLKRSHDAELQEMGEHCRDEIRRLLQKHRTVKKNHETDLQKKDARIRGLNEAARRSASIVETLNLKIKILHHRIDHNVRIQQAAQRMSALEATGHKSVIGTGEQTDWKEMYIREHEKVKKLTDDLAAQSNANTGSLHYSKIMEHQLKMRDTQISKYQQLLATRNPQHDSRELELCKRALTEERMQSDYLRHQLDASNSYARLHEQKYRNLLVSNGPRPLNQSAPTGETARRVGVNTAPHPQLQASKQTHNIGLTGLPYNEVSMLAPARGGVAIQVGAGIPETVEARNISVPHNLKLPPIRTVGPSGNKS